MMTALPDFPSLDSPAKCAALWPRFPEKVVGMWATGFERQNVDVLWRLREELIKLGVPVVFFFTESAKPMLRTVLPGEPEGQEHIYQLDEAQFFRLLNFVEVLVTNDYLVYYPQSRHIRAKLVGMPHHGSDLSPNGWNYFYDYLVGGEQQLRPFDYSCFPDACKIHRNRTFTQLPAGHPKIDLVAEERQKCASASAPPVLLLYPAYVEFATRLQKIGPDTYVDLWSRIISAFLSWRPSGLVVFRPTVRDRTHPLVQRLKARFAGDGRFILDEDDDNKFWLARAEYFVTDYSRGHVNFSLTAGKPSIRMVYSPNEESPRQDEWGWTISSPEHLTPLLEQADNDAQFWKTSLRGVQEREMPTLGHSFALLAGMIKRIFSNDDAPEWPRIDKGHTSCRTPGDMLKVVARYTRKNRDFSMLDIWLFDLLEASAGREAPQIWLLLLRHALLPHLGASTPVADIARHIDTNLNNTLNRLPMAQGIGLLRHCLRKEPHLAATALLITATSCHINGPAKKRALFFLLMEADQCGKALATVNELAGKMPQHFSRPVLDKLNRFLPLAMKVPLPLRRYGARVLGLKKPLARSYWRSHLALCPR